MDKRVMLDAFDFWAAVLIALVVTIAWVRVAWRVSEGKRGQLVLSALLCFLAAWALVDGAARIGLGKIPYWRP